MRSCGDSSALAASSVTIGCNNGGSCAVGDTVVLDAIVTLSGLSSGGVIINAQAYKYSFSYDIYKDYYVDICDSAIPTSDGYQCPEDGEYEISAIEFQWTNYYAYMSGSTITAKMTFTDEDLNSLGCISSSVSIAKNKGYTSTAYAALVVMPLAGFTVAASIYRRYKVKTQVLSLEDNASGTSFVGAVLA
jgi:hypothetical protein